MPKSRRRSRDLRKRAEKKRLKREKLVNHLALITKQSTAILDAAELTRKTDSEAYSEYVAAKIAGELD